MVCTYICIRRLRCQSQDQDRAEIEQILEDEAERLLNNFLKARTFTPRIEDDMVAFTGNNWKGAYGSVALIETEGKKFVLKIVVKEPGQGRVAIHEKKRTCCCQSTFLSSQELLPCIWTT